MPPAPPVIMTVRPSRRNCLKTLSSIGGSGALIDCLLVIVYALDLFRGVADEWYGRPHSHSVVGTSLRYRGHDNPSHPATGVYGHPATHRLVYPVPLDS